MDRQTMKNSHEVQIKALLEGDYETFKSEFPNSNIVFEKFNTDHHSAWGYTGRYEHSLFGCLPESEGCLTQIKGHTQESEEWYELLDLGNNDLIPTNVQEDTIFSEAQLREFSRLQLQAWFPEEVT